MNIRVAKAYICCVMLFECLSIHASAADNKETGNLRVSLDYRQAPLWEVFKDFARQTDIHFVVEPVIQDRQITIYVRDVNPDDVLEAIAVINRLRYEHRNGTCYVSGIKPSTPGVFKSLNND